MPKPNTPSEAPDGSLSRKKKIFAFLTASVLVVALNYFFARSLFLIFVHYHPLEKAVAIVFFICEAFIMFQTIGFFLTVLRVHQKPRLPMAPDWVIPVDAPRLDAVSPMDLPRVDTGAAMDVPVGSVSDLTDPKALADTHMKARLQIAGMAAVGDDSDQFSKAIAEESKGWAVVVKNRGLTAN